MGLINVFKKKILKKEIAKEYIEKIGDFEKLAEWVLY